MIGNNFKLRSASILFVVSSILLLANFVSAAIYDATGEWNLSISNGWTDGGDNCPLEEDETGPVTITQDGDSFTLVAGDGTLSGSITDNNTFYKGMNIILIKQSDTDATFDYGVVISEYRHCEPPFTTPDSYFMIAAAYVDTDTFPVHVQNIPGISGDTSLYKLPGWNDLTPYLYARVFGSPAPGVDWENRTYTFYIDLDQNGQKDYGEPTTTWNIPQGLISQMALVQNVSISAGYNPTITWDAAPNADAYRIRFVPIKDGNPDFSVGLFESDEFSGLSSYSFTYNGSLFNTYGSLAVVIEAWEDYSGQMINRSRYIVQHAPGATGRDLLFNHGNPTYSGLVAANQKFKDALSADPNNQEANLFYSVTRIGVFALEEGSGGGFETLRDMFQAFGMTRNDIEFIDDGSPYDTPSQLPGISPAGEEIRQFFVGPCMTLLNGALANLEEIDSSFKTTLTADETGDEAVQIDYGDVLMYKAMLNASKCLFLIMSSYNINVDTDEIVNKIINDQFSINSDLLDTYPDFLKLIGGGGDTLLSAETVLLDTINSYLDASTFIRSETDYQPDDLISFDPEDLMDEELFRQNLNELEESLTDNRTADLTDNVEHLLLNLNLLFGDESGPYHLRDFLPLFNQCNNPIAGTVGHGLGDDPTLGGILPGYLQADWGIEQATIGSVCVASEYRHYQAPFTKTDTYSMLSWAIVDKKTYDVYLQNVPGSTGDILLNYVPLWDDFTPYQFAKDFSSPLPGAAWEDVDYNFYVEGHLDDKTWYIPQGSIQQMGYPSTVTVSGGIHPTITWSKVADADWYKVRIFPIVDGNPNRGDLLDQSGNITDDGSLSYSYHYTGDAFDTYGTLAVAVETYDDAGLISGWVNRSVHCSQHNPASEIYVNKDDGMCGGKEPCRQSITQAIEDAGCEVLIKVTSGIYNEDIALTALKFITLQGGYDSLYESQTGTTTANSMTIKNGTITVSNIVLGPAAARCSPNEQNH